MKQSNAVPARSAHFPAVRWQLKRKLKLGTASGLQALVLVAVMVNGLFPALWIALTSFKTEAELASTPISWWPQQASLANYLQAFVEQPLLLFVANSLGISLLSTALTVGIAIGTAYALTRLPIRHRGLLLTALVTLAMCPPATLQVPLFELMRSLSLLNTWAALILPNAVISLPVCTLVIISAFQGVPASLEQAAMLDGCTRLGAMRRIALPLAAPGIFAAAILAFVNAWDEFLLALVLNAAPANRTLPVGILLYQGEYSFPWPVISAALVVAIVPLLVLIALFQKRIVSNLTAGGLKG